MSIRRLCVALLSVLLTRAAVAQVRIAADAGSVVGCYSAKTTTPPASTDGRVLYALPNEVRLDSAAVNGRHGGVVGWRVLPEITSFADTLFGDPPHWHARGDSVLVEWFSGFHGLALDLVRAGTGFKGQARIVTDLVSIKGDPPPTPVVLSPIACSPQRYGAEVVQDAIERFAFGYGLAARAGQEKPTDDSLVVDVLTSIEVVSAAGVDVSAADSGLARPRFNQSAPRVGDATFCQSRPKQNANDSSVTKRVCGLTRDVSYVTVGLARLRGDSLELVLYRNQRGAFGIASLVQQIFFARSGGGEWRFVRFGLGAIVDD